MPRVRDLSGLALLVVFEGTAVGMLHRLGSLPWMGVDWSDLATWVRVTPPEDAIVSIVRLVALVFAYWLAAGTAAYVVLKATHLPSTVRWLTLPVIRRVVDRALAVTLALSSVPVPPAGAMSTAQFQALVVEPQEVLLPIEVTASTVDPSPVIPTAPVFDLPPQADVLPLPPFPHEIRAAEQDPGPEQPARWTVQPGDNLWVISRRHLEGALGHRPTNHEVAPYWRRVIDANTARLISGDPDLIYPGEVIELPDPE